MEDLRIGDLLVAFSGELRPIRWIGRRGYDGRFVTGNNGVLPICIRPGTLAVGVPTRDLWVSPEHSLYIDDVLVQAKHLINGHTVVQSDSVNGNARIPDALLRPFSASVTLKVHLTTNISAMRAAAKGQLRPAHGRS